MKNATLILVLSLLVLTCSFKINAQSSNYKNVTKNSIKTLEQGIKSENEGVRRSSIYMAGLYKIDEVVDVLVDQLHREKDSNTKILIALALYNIGNPKGMEAVKDLSAKDQDMRVKRMTTAIYRAYTENYEDISQR